MVRQIASAAIGAAVAGVAYLLACGPSPPVSKRSPKAYRPISDAMRKAISASSARASRRGIWCRPIACSPGSRRRPNWSCTPAPIRFRRLHRLVKANGARSRHACSAVRRRASRRSSRSRTTHRFLNCADDAFADRRADSAGACRPVQCIEPGSDRIRARTGCGLSELRWPCIVAASSRLRPRRHWCARIAAITPRQPPFTRCNTPTRLAVFTRSPPTRHRRGGRTDGTSPRAR